MTHPPVGEAKKPKYERLVRQISADLSGRPEHTVLPTERELSETFRVSRSTVRKALRSLESRGTIYRVQGAGTFTSANTISKSMTLTSFSEDMIARGRTPDSRLLAPIQRATNPDVAIALGLPETAHLIRLVRLRLADQRPMCLESTFIPGELAPELLKDELAGSLYEHFRARGIKPTRAEQVVTAVTLEETEANLLDVGPGSAAIVITRTTFDPRDRSIERTRSVYRADRYDLAFTVRRAK